MAKGYTKGKGGGGGGGGGRGARAGIPSGGATNGESHTVAGKRYNTGKIVDSALSSARVTPDDRQRTIDRLRQSGNLNPESDPRVPKLAAERAILRAIQSQLPRSNVLNQWGNGRWDMSSANGITESLNRYLGRRTTGIHARWTERTGGR